MTICVTATGKNLNDSLDPKFGRSQYFVFVDPETMEFDSFENPGVSASGGAGIQAAQAIADRKVDILITGNVGPKAFSVLSKANVKVFTGASGTVKQAIDDFKAGLLEETENPTVKTHNGINR